MFKITKCILCTVFHYCTVHIQGVPKISQQMRIVLYRNAEKCLCKFTSIQKRKNDS